MANILLDLLGDHPHYTCTGNHFVIPNGPTAFKIWPRDNGRWCLFGEFDVDTFRRIFPDPSRTSCSPIPCSCVEVRARTIFSRVVSDGPSR